MKTLYVTQGSNILINPDDNTADKIESSPVSIDRVYLIEEPTHIVYGYGETHIEADADKGDLVVVFYNREFDNRMIVVKNEQWTENIVEFYRKEQEEKERWAASKCECCDNTSCEPKG